MVLVSHIHNFASNTSAHGVARAFNSVSIRQRVFWGFVFVVGLSYSIFQTYRILEQYLRYPRNTLIDVEYVKYIEFPAVTICNKNPYSQAVLDEVIHYLPDENDYDWSNYDYTYYDDDGEPLFEENSDFLDEVKDSSEYISLVNEQLPTLREKTIAGTAIGDFTIECAFNGRKCDLKKDFILTLSGRYGNCYTYNYGFDKPAIRFSKTGARAGLTLTLFVNQDDYGTAYTQSAGARIVLHQPGQSPFPIEEGFDVAPGFETSLAVQLVELTPTSTIVSTDRSHVSQDSEGISRRDSLRVKGFADIITEFDLQSTGGTQIHETYNATTPDYESNTDYNQSTPSTDSTSPGYESNTTASADGYDFITDSSLGNGTSQNETGTNYNTGTNMTEEIIQILDTSLNIARNNFLKVNVYFQELIIYNITDVPAYAWENLMAELGGTFGLCIGFSLMTIMEFVELVVIIIQDVACKRRKSDETQVVISSSADIQEMPQIAWPTDKKHQSKHMR
ncbi:PREDICTED: degenerin-like protein asic-1 [Priapulus caudatus]|uniref:Degenerin-like protein asic-1 n=1 Tax=Priapulus caudatus TaxID=37621 RepID=A0ABM1DS10_PRICU|nr:PREDICTED: degenerin-like protein asic-1 [Priapulus caudatus]